MASASRFDKPEQAAMFGFPERYCRVVASAVNGDDAFVLLDTGSDGRSYLYGVQCRRSNGQWFDAGSSNASGWWQCGSDPERGALAFYDEAPEGADVVRVVFSDAVNEVLVRAGAYLAVWWNTECPPLEAWPRVVEVHVGGEWRRLAEHDRFP